MARPRSYDLHAVIEAAKGAFWDQGYEATGLQHLEAATGVSRSSLYVAFGSKRALFSAVLADYEASFIDPLLSRVEVAGATAADAVAFFATLARLFRGHLGGRGCLMINSIAELGGRDAEIIREGRRFHRRYRAAFLNALGGADGASRRPEGVVGRRASLLAEATMGLWAASRVDPKGAAVACQAIIAEIHSWAGPS